MKKIKLFFNLTLLLTIFNQSAAFAQSPFSHAIGISQYYALGQYGNTLGVTYSPRINFAKLSDEISLSAGSHLGVAISLQLYDPFMVYDIPTVVEFNFGKGSTSHSLSQFGGFIGGGYGYHLGRPFDSEVKYGLLTTHGFLVNAGIRGDIMGYAINMRLSYLVGSGADKVDIISFGTFINIGEPKSYNYW